MANRVRDQEGVGFSTGRVFSRAFGTIRANPLAALGIVLLFGALPGEIYLYAAELVHPASAFDAVAISKIPAAWAVGAICSSLEHGAFVGLTSAHDAAQRPRFSAALRAGMRALFPLMALGLITSLGTLIGFAALIVPGVMLGLMWFVSAPVMVEEQCGPIAAISRSRALTQGARWPILGIALLMGALELCTGFLNGLVIGPLYFHMSGHAFSVIGSRLIRAATGTIVRLVSAAVYTSIYVELRNWKHGTPEDALAEIFA